MVMKMTYIIDPDDHPHDEHELAFHLDRKMQGLPPYDPTYDHEAFIRMVESGRDAWADVPDASKWVDELRGGEDD